MVKPPKIRHSKLRKDPVTIDLDPAEVKREEKTAEAAEAVEAQTASTSRLGEHSSAEPHSAGFQDAEDPITPNAADEALADGEPAPGEREHAPDRTAPGGEAQRYGRAASESVKPAAQRTAIPTIAAGVVGAVLALLGGAALQWAGALPSPRTEATILDSGPLDQLRAEFDALKQEVAAGYGEAANPAIAQSLARSDEQVAGLAAEIERLRTEFAAQPQQGGAAPDSAELAALEARLVDLERAAGAASDNGAALEQVNLRLAELTDGARTAAEEAEELTSRLDALDERVAALVERVEAQAAEPGMAMAVAATALKSAIDRGTPFMMELETYAALAPETPEIAELRNMAASGVPTRAAIEAEIPDAAGRMLAAANPVDENAGFVERMFTSARSLVEVRPVGSVEGEGPAAGVARMEVALRQGDYAEAIEQFETLPPPARAAGQEFIGKVRARLAADRLLTEALSGAVKASGEEG